MDEGICVIDHANRVVGATPRFNELVGRDGLGERIYELAPWLAHLQHGPSPGERLILVNGVEMRVRTQPIAPSSELEGAHSLVSIRDLSEQKRAEDELRVSRHVLQSLIDASPAAVIALDRDMKVTLWNPAAETMTGWKRKEVMGQRYPLVPAEKREEFRAFFNRVFSGEGFTGIPATRQRKDGSELELELSTAPMRDAAGAVDGAMAILQDVSERQRLERRASEGQKMEALGRLAGGIAHDFNNLLTVIAGSVDIAVAAPADATRQLDDIRLAAKKASLLTKKLLAFSRRQILKPRIVDLPAVLQDTARMLERLLGDDVELSVSSAHDTGAVRVDEGQLELVLVNLALNGRDAMPEGGQLAIRTQRREVVDEGGSAAAPPGDYVEISVVDTGQGMPLSVREKIFEPFFTTKEEGTGLGLATVHGVVQQSGGVVEVSSEPGRGSSFRVLLPRVEVSPDPAAESSPGLPTGTEVILLVEDHDAVRETLHRMLESLGYGVIAMSDPAAALAEIERRDVALLFTDVTMPNMTGVELAHRATRLRPDLPVLFSSGNVDSAVERHGLATSHARVLAKPFNMQKLASVVREALDGEPGF